MDGFFLKSRTDAELVREALADSPAAFEALVLRYQRKAHAIAQALGSAGTAADDVVQDAFLRAFRVLPALRSPDAFGPWFLAIVRNTARKHLRRANLPVSPEALERLEGPETGGLEGEEFRELLWRKVAELPEGIREAIFLYYHENRSVRAVARTLGTTGSAVKARLKRGRDLLRERLWRELRACLRDMLPSTREWKGRARRLALIALASLPPAWGLEASGAAAAVPAAASTAPALLARILGVSFMSGKKIALGISLTVLLFLGAVTVFTDPFGRNASAPPDAGVDRHAVSRPYPSPAGGGADRNPAALAPLPREERVPEAAAVSVLGRVASGGRAVSGARLIALDLAAWERIDEGEKNDVSPAAPSSERLGKLRAAYLKQAESAPRTTSGPDGSYRFLGLAEGIYRVIASHEEYLPAVDSFATVRAGAPARCDVELVPALAISGKVVDESGRGVAGAALEAESVARSGLQGAERLERIQADWREGRALLGTAACESGPDGSFRLGSLEPAAHELTARKEGYLPAKSFGIPGGAREVVLTLSRGSSLSGRVLDPVRAPVKGAEVVLTRARSAEVHRLFDWIEGEIDPRRDEVRASTGADGRFRLEGFSAGSLDLAIGAEGFPPHLSEIAHTGGALDLGDLLLEEGRSISGAVYGPSGEPLSGARVWATWPPKQIQPSNRLRLAEAEPVAEARSGAGGSFSLSGLKAGAYQVRAEAEGFAAAAASGVAAGERGVKLILRRGLVVEGLVVDAETSAPVSGAEVRLGFRGEIRADTDSRGAFRAAGLALDSLHGQGTTTVMVSHSAYDTWQDWNARVLGRDARSPLRVRLSRSERIIGRITDSAGAPAAGAQVWIEVLGLPAAAMGYNPARDLRAAAQSGGEFTLPAPGSLRSMMGDLRYSVVASHPLHGRGRVGPFGLPPTGGKWPEAEIVLGGSSIEGKVTDEEGRPVALARIACRRLEGSPSPGRQESGPSPAVWNGPVAWSGPDGSYRLTGAETGPCEVLASALGFAPRRVGGLELGPGTLPVDLVLEAGRSVEGRVVDADGAAIAGAEVVALPDGAEAGPDEEASEFVRRMSLLRSPALASTRSGPEGRFRLSHLPGRSCTLVARADGYEAAAVSRGSADGSASGRGAAEVAEILLILPRFGVVAGRVATADRKEPVTEFLVDVLDKKKLPAGRPRGPFPSDYRVASEGELRIRDPQGRFLYDGLRPGEYLLLVHAPGFDFTTREVSIRSGEEVNVEILLDPGLGVNGIVLDAETDEPVAGASISRGGAVPFGGGIAPFPPPLVTGEDGTFALGGLRAGSYTFHSTHPYYLPAHAGPLEIPQPEKQPVVLKLAPAGRLEGRIRGLAGGQLGKRGVQSTLFLASAEEEAGKPAKGGPHMPFHHLWTDPEGRYAAESLKPGRYVLKVKKQEMERGESVHLGPSGGFVASRPVGPEEITVLGEVEIRARETAVFDAAVE